MKLLWKMFVPLAVALSLCCPLLGYADTVSYTGTLASPEDVWSTTLTLASPSEVILQTFGFGGGTNAAGTVISPGGTDPFLAIFAGTGDSATILTDMGNPFGTSLILTNYGSFGGCPPAGTASVGCGDIRMDLLSVAAGTYTVVLSDGAYIANAVFDNGALGEGFADLTGDAFCNLTGAEGCTGAWALDITTPSTAVPEPGTLVLLGSGLGMLGWYRRRKRD